MPESESDPGQRATQPVDGAAGPFTTHDRKAPAATDLGDGRGSGSGTAPVIRGDVPDSFARSVLVERHPALIEKVRAAFPYGPDQQRALDALLDEVHRDVMEPLPPDAHDRARWAAWGWEHVGRSWLSAPFLWAESYFYRRLLDAVGYFAPGPWQGVDPFRPFKVAELDTAEAREELAVLDELALRPVDDQATALLHGSLWGNRADLGFQVGRAAEQGRGADTPLVADDSAALWDLLPLPAGTDGETAATGASTGARTVCLVADNAGRELLPDLLLIDHLLRHRRAGRVLLHVKAYPYYVSDATTADVLDCLRRLRQGGRAAAEAGERLWTAAVDGRLTLRAHPFSCAPLGYCDLPGDLREEFAGTDVTLFKGDLNYRRLVGDRRWPPTVPFAERTAYFPSPVAALRTLKSDVITGLTPDRETSLVTAYGQGWRTDGTHALVQVRG